MILRLLEVARDVGLFVLVAAAAVFATLYGLLTPWRRTDFGRNIMALFGAIVVFAGFGLFRWGWEAVTGQELPRWLRLAVNSLAYWTVAAIVMHRTWLLLRGQAMRGERVLSGHQGAMIPPPVEGDHHDRVRDQPAGTDPRP